MHCELLVPGLLSARAPARLPALELLLARGRSRKGEARRFECWLAEGFQLGEQPLAAGALTVSGAGGDPSGALWARADPVHLKLMREGALLLPGEALAVSAAEASALCEALNRHFAGTLQFEPLRPTCWVARLQVALTLAPESAFSLAGQEVAPGAGAGEAQRLLTEAQMLLHGHPINEAREARGEPALNSVWLWGAGAAPRVPACPWHSVAAADPIALGLARLAGARHIALPHSGEAWLDRAAEDGRHLAVLDALRLPLALSDGEAVGAALQELERRWFAPLLSALREGRAGMLSVHVPDAREGVSFQTVRGDLRRIWRRRQPLECYA